MIIRIAGIAGVILLLQYMYMITIAKSRFKRDFTKISWMQAITVPIYCLLLFEFNSETRGSRLTFALSWFFLPTYAMTMFVAAVMIYFGTSYGMIEINESVKERVAVTQSTFKKTAHTKFNIPKISSAF